VLNKETTGTIDFNVFGMTRPLSGIGPWTSRIISLGYRGGIELYNNKIKY